MSLDKIVQVVAVRHAFVAAGRAVSMLMIVGLAIMIGSAGIRIITADWKRVFIDMSIMDVVHVTVMKIVCMAFV